MRLPAAKALAFARVLPVQRNAMGAATTALRMMSVAAPSTKVRARTTTQSRGRRL